MEPEARREAELAAYHKFKQDKVNSEILYLVDQKWLEQWIVYLRGACSGNDVKSPDYI